MDIVWGNPRRNIAQAELLIRQAGASDLYVLPEMFTTGFSMNPAPLAEPAEGPTLQWMRQMSAQHQAAIVGSIIVRDGGQHLNQMLFVTPDGRAVRYNKRHLFRMGGEHRHYSPGAQQVVAEHGGWRIRLLTCYDLRFPVWCRNRSNGYDLLVVCASWPAARTLAWETLLAARAIENQCYVVACNRVGPDGHGVEHLGRSAIYSPWGERLVLAPDGQPAVIGAQLDMQALRGFRASFPVANDADAFELLG